VSIDAADNARLRRRPEEHESARLTALARAALARYGLAGARVEFLSDSDNLVFRVYAGGAEESEFALRVYRPLRFSSDEIEDELRWVAALAREAGLSVPVPVPGVAGRLVQSVSVDGLPGRRQCALFHWVRGEFLGEALRPGHLESVGLFMARLHEEGTRLAHAYQFRRARRLNHDYLPRLIEAKRRALLMFEIDDFGLLVKAARLIGARIADAEREGLEVGLLHADLHQRNYLFAPDGVGAIDFCECCWGPYLHDIAVTLSDLHIDKPLDELPGLHEAFLSGYRRVRPLPRGYERHIETFLLARTLQVLEWVFRWPSPTHHAWGASYLTEAVGYVERCLT
jgi:Ser/Thr protein kinase RdoA (MazF antagonist)